VNDTVRHDAHEVVAWLKRRGISTVMVTGDRELPARSVARKLGIDVLHSSMRPEQKLNLVMSLQQRGETVLVIGDGINDSPALAQADVGVAIGGFLFFLFFVVSSLFFSASAPVAVEAADIVLMRNTLSDLCTAIDLSQTVFSRIRINFMFALMYNCIGVPLAAGVMYPLIRPMAMPPAVCALAMALSSTSVVFSSLLLKRYKAPKLNTTGLSK
jgi:Cu+-exporting ATPase